MALSRNCCTTRTCNTTNTIVIAGPRGPAGSVGPRGPTGPTGPTGPSNLPSGSATGQYLSWNGDAWESRGARIRIGDDAGLSESQDAVAVGAAAGQTDQSAYAVAIGSAAGFKGQGGGAVAVGERAARMFQTAGAVAVGRYAGETGQAADAVALGSEAGRFAQRAQGVAVGNQAGRSSQGIGAIAVGDQAGTADQQWYAVAIGALAGTTGQGEYAVAIGKESGKTMQGPDAVALGVFSGKTNQGDSSVAVGAGSGSDGQGSFAVAIGASAGSGLQSGYAVAIGNGAGLTGQGEYAIAIGDNASNSGQAPHSIGIGRGCECSGQYGIAIGGRAAAGDHAIVLGGVTGDSTSGPANSIVLNASGNPFTAGATGNFYVSPVAESPGINAAPLYYDTTTAAITYRTSPSVLFATLPAAEVIVSNAYMPLTDAVVQIQTPMAQRTAVVTITANASRLSGTLPIYGIYVSFGVQDNEIPGVTINPSDTQALVLEVTTQACASATFALTLDPAFTYPGLLTPYARCSLLGESITLNSLQMVVQLS